MAKPMNTETIEKTITLETPIKRGETEITEVVMRKPTTGDLFGLKLMDILTFDVATVAEILPRIATPSLTKIEIRALDVADFTALATSLAEFFAKNSETAE